MSSPLTKLSDLAIIKEPSLFDILFDYPRNVKHVNLSMLAASYTFFNIANKNYLMTTFVENIENLVMNSVDSFKNTEVNICVLNYNVDGSTKNTNKFKGEFVSVSEPSKKASSILVEISYIFEIVSDQ